MDTPQAAVGHWAKRLTYAARALLESSLRPLGLGATQYQVLWHLAHDGPLPQRVLPALLNIEKPTISEIVGTLVAKGLASQSPDPEDKRQKQLTLTQPGLALWQSLPDPTELILKTAFHDVPEADLAIAAHVLQAATERLQAHLNEGKNP